MRNRPVVLSKLLLCGAITAFSAYLLGMFVAAIVHGAPADWLIAQTPTDRLPRVIALLALGPILLVGLLALRVCLGRRWKSKVKTQTRNEEPASSETQSPRKGSALLTPSSLKSQLESGFPPQTSSATSTRPEPGAEER